MSVRQSTTAANVMSPDVLSLTEDAPIKEAIALLEDYHISGAPVLNAGGECVGVFSVTDLLKRKIEEDEGEAPRPGAYFSGDPLSDDPADWASPREDYDLAILGRDRVAQWMTTEIQSVTPNTALHELCKLMADEQIHRVLVLEGAALRGIVTSFDIVRWVASA